MQDHMCRICDADNLWVSMLSACILTGKTIDSREGTAREVMGFCGKISDMRACVVLNKVRNMHSGYASAEALMYITGADNVAYLEPHAPSYRAKWADSKTGVCHGAWGPALYRGASYALAAGLLTSETRRAMIPIWQQEHITQSVNPNIKCVPCLGSVTLQPRNGKLHAHMHMRSQDAWLGAPYDLFAICAWACAVAAAADLRPGGLTYTAASLHLYEKHNHIARPAIDAHWEEEKCNKTPVDQIACYPWSQRPVLLTTQANAAQTALRMADRIHRATKRSKEDESLVAATAGSADYAKSSIVPDLCRSNIAMLVQPSTGAKIANSIIHPGLRKLTKTNIEGKKA